MIEHLKKLSSEEVELFLSTRNPEPLGIPEKLAEYILQINEAADLLREHKYISECARKLQESYPKLSIPTCKSRVYDAIQYFNHSSSVTATEWNSYFADQMMELYQKNMEARDFREARLCMEKSLEYYLSASANSIDPERIRFKPQIVSADMELERMGVKKQGILSAYKKALSIIDQIDATDLEKNRIIDEVERELNITDIPHEDIRD